MPSLFQKQETWRIIVTNCLLPIQFVPPKQYQTKRKGAESYILTATHTPVLQIQWYYVSLVHVRCPTTYRDTLLTQGVQFCFAVYVPCDHFMQQQFFDSVHELISLLPVRCVRAHANEITWHFDDSVWAANMMRQFILPINRRGVFTDSKVTEAVLSSRKMRKEFQCVPHSNLYLAAGTFE
jgi:hypothetical protein